jgi:exodeoxyribonuclease-3
MKLYSWNVNGIRAAEKKGLFEWLHTTKPDILCLQETKAHVGQLSPKMTHPDGYESYWNSAIRPGYSGTATYTRSSPIMSMTNFGDSFLDGEGRIILNEFQDFFLFNVYFPNGGSGEERLAFKMEFYKRFFSLMEDFRKQKPIILCGDVNTAHTDIDLARPKENHNTSGFLPMERAWIDKLVDHGYVDTLRLFHPEPHLYTWWDMKSGARARNVGWRIDYFFVSKELVHRIKSAEIHPDIMGSDHCPVSLTLSD